MYYIILLNNKQEKYISFTPWLYHYRPYHSTPIRNSQLTFFLQPIAIYIKSYWIIEIYKKYFLHRPLRPVKIREIGMNIEFFVSNMESPRIINRKEKENKTYYNSLCIFSLSPLRLSEAFRIQEYTFEGRAIFRHRKHEIKIIFFEECRQLILFVFKRTTRWCVIYGVKKFQNYLENHFFSLIIFCLPSIRINDPLSWFLTIFETFFQILKRI